VVTVSRDALDPWSAARNFRDFFDRHLVSSASAPDLIEVEVQDQDSFALQREPDKTWRVTPQGFPADAMLVAGVISNMAVMQASDIAKYSVTEFDLPGFGLAPRPSRRYSLKTVGASATGNPTNALIAQLDFGVKEDKVYAVCAGENFVYAVNPSDLRLLPSASWQMRERRIWNFAAGDAVRITSRRDGKTRELIRKGTDSWSFAPGSQGILDEVVITAIEETVRRFGELSAAAWLERGDQNRAGFGFTPEGWQISVELKDGRKFSVEFGGTAPSGLPCAQTVLDGQPWLFEFPLRTYQLALTYLAVSPNLP
jgi:hypothetical protein